MLSPCPRCIPKSATSLAYDCGLSQQMIDNNVDFPAPFCPDKAHLSPLRIFQSRSFRMVLGPYCIFTFLRFTMSSLLPIADCCCVANNSLTISGCASNMMPLSLLSIRLMSVIKSGTSVSFVSISTICNPCSWAISANTPFSCSRVSLSKPMNGLSIMSFFGRPMRALQRTNFLSSPDDSSMMYLSNK